MVLRVYQPGEVQNAYYVALYLQHRGRYDPQLNIGHKFLPYSEIQIKCRKSEEIYNVQLSLSRPMPQRDPPRACHIGKRNVQDDGCLVSMRTFKSWFRLLRIAELVDRKPTQCNRH